VRHGLRILPLAVLGAVAACDRITDPGPVDDSVLDQPLANAAIVNGMAKSLSRALGYIAYTGAAVSREVVGSGSTSTPLFGITVKQRSGLLDPAFAEANDHWQLAQQARWIAEDGVRRMRGTLGDQFAKSTFAADALVHAGFANRLLGENMCDAVIDGGPKEPRRVYFERAEAAFSEAITVAGGAGSQNLERAARAGRASVRLWLGNYAGASDDAKLVPSNFIYQARYSAAELDQYNRLYWSNANQPYRAHSVVGTFYDSYYQSTGDARTRWARNPSIPNGTTATVPWYFQTKFDRRESPMNLVSGREMRLIVAEALLRGGDWAGAVAAINQTRAELGVAPWSATGVEQAWVALKRERGIELWLEGRRLGDLHRWLADGVPGAVEDMTGRNTCFPIGQNELDANPNL
jgi:hypothetical protein